MSFSFSSVLNASIFGFVLIGSIYVFGQSRSFLRKINPGILILLAYIILFRLICPIEFPFTVSVYYKGFLSSIQKYIITKELSLFSADIMLTTLMFAVWTIGFLIALGKYAFGYCRTKKVIEMSEVVDDGYIDEIIQKINTKYGRDKKFHIVYVPDAATPMIFGPVKPYIILPEKEIPREECFYILYHELVHYFRGHLHIKMIFAFLTCVYWWNPFVYLLSRFVNDFLEMEVDNHIAGQLDEMERFDYMQCLLDRSKTQLRNKIIMKDSVTFCERNTSLIARRISLICDKAEAGSDKLFSGITVTVFLAAFAMSSLLIFEPYSYRTNLIENKSIDEKNDAMDSLKEKEMLDSMESPDAIGDVESFLYFSDSGTFLVRNENGGFDLYSDYVYIVTIEELFSEDKKMRIYDSLEEALQNEK